MKIDAIELSKKLIRFPSITPVDAGCIDYLAEVLESIGFDSSIMNFSDKKDPSTVKNLYARIGKKGKNLCFAGHTDVVPPGNISDWKNDPFIPKIINGVLYGRGASDMKTAIAAWVSACSEYLSSKNKNTGSLSLLITGDEEGVSINGTKKVLEELKKRKEKIDHCIVGEPTNSEKLGDTIKIGRRGSISFELTILGVQGHAAYPEKADNPVTKIIKILNELKAKKLDNGNKFFQPSNLEITTIDVGNKVGNVIPAKAFAKFNIRFNDAHSSKKLEAWVKSVCKKHKAKFELKVFVTGEAFITTPSKFTKIVSDVIHKETKIKPKLSTSGGTSDARFIKSYSEVLEFGLINTTAHKVDEAMPVIDIEKLAVIYRKIIENYFKAF